MGKIPPQIMKITIFPLKERESFTLTNYPFGDTFGQKGVLKNAFLKLSEGCHVGVGEINQPSTCHSRVRTLILEFGFPHTHIKSRLGIGAGGRLLKKFPVFLNRKPTNHQYLCKRNFLVLYNPRQQHRSWT